MQLNHQTLAGISIGGSCLDVLGSFYLAYDVLGGEHGPLRLVTRVVTSIELNREARRLPRYSLKWQALFAAIRSAGFGAGLYSIVGFQFAAAFAVLSEIGQVFAYSRSVRPGMDYSRSQRPRLTRRLGIDRE